MVNSSVAITIMKLFIHFVLGLKLKKAYKKNYTPQFLLLKSSFKGSKISTYLDGVLEHVDPFYYLLTCVIMWFFQHYLSQGKPVCQISPLNLHKTNA